jgi:menaquinone-dependent protoporphyrinogen oxidase
MSDSPAREPAPGLDPATDGSRPVLVAYATKHGSNVEVAEAIAGVLRDDGLSVDVVPAAEVRSVRPYRAVVLGSGLYSATWLRDANRFIRTHRAALSTIPVWLWSSGPLDRSADFDDIPMTTHVAEALGGLPIRGHRTFGGRLDADAPEVAAGIIATHRTGDHRDFDAIRAWAREIAVALA